jgi:hypothetical protein
MSKFQIALIGSATLILIILMVMVFNIEQKKTDQANISLSPTPKIFIQEFPTPIKLPKKIITSLPQPKKIAQIPTLLPTQGQGIDISSDEVKASQMEIQKLAQSLPYEKNVLTTNNLEVQVFIAPVNLQDNPWTITIQTYGIDFQIPEGTEEGKMKQSFQEVVDDTFTWISSKGADPENIIIQWGDREFMQKRAEDWLQ